MLPTQAYRKLGHQYFLSIIWFFFLLILCS